MSLEIFLKSSFKSLSVNSQVTPTLLFTLSAESCICRKRRAFLFARCLRCLCWTKRHFNGLTALTCSLAIVSQFPCESPAWQNVDIFPHAVIPNPNPSGALAKLCTLLDHLRDQCTWPHGSIHVLGFAQGGSIAAECPIAWSRHQSTERPSLTLGSVVAIDGPLLSYPTLAPAARLDVPVLAWRRSSVSDAASLKRAYNHVETFQARRAEGGMPQNQDEWLPIMRSAKKSLLSPTRLRPYYDANFRADFGPSTCGTCNRGPWAKATKACSRFQAIWLDRLFCYPGDEAGNFGAGGTSTDGNRKDLDKRYEGPTSSIMRIPQKLKIVSRHLSKRVLMTTQNFQSLTHAKRQNQIVQRAKSEPR